ncbi:MAG: DedA family protein [Anaeromyxobacteraceae bacterium]
MLQRLVDLLGERSLDVGYVFVFGVLVLCGFGFPMPEDVVLVTGGVLAWMESPLETITIGDMVRDPGLQHMVLVGLAGILAGDSVIYWLGRRLGVRVAEFRLLRRLVPPEKLEEVEKRLRRRGKLVVVLARYLPGLRAPTYFTVGHSRLPYWQFLLFDGLAALVSAPLWVCLGFWFGDDIGRAAREATRFGHFILAAVAVILAIVAARWWQRRRTATATNAGGGRGGRVEPGAPER